MKKNSRLRAATITAAVASLATTGLTFGAVTAAADPGGNSDASKKLRKEVSVSKIMKHLDEFQEIADENGGTRASGTPGYEASGRYVEKRLKKAGYKTKRQYFPFTYTEILAENVRVNGANQRTIDNHVMTASPSTPPGGVTANLVTPADPADPLGCEATDWDGTAVAGQIALVSRGTCPFAQKSQAANTAGAAAVIIYNNADGELNGTLGDNPQGVAPTTGITQADGQALIAEMAAGAVNLTVDLRTLVEQRQTFNVIAETKRGDADDVIMLGSHLDSVVGGPGINDNASGTSTVLTVAEEIANPKYKLDGKVRFAWWGAEETGLVGSTFYVNQLKEKPGALQDIATYLNFDMLGSPNFQIGVYDANNSNNAGNPNPDGVVIPPGSIETESVFTEYFDSVDQPWNDTAFSGRSDYQAFINNGVAAGGLFSGGDGTKTPAQVGMYGGTAGIHYDPNYHTPADDIDNVSRESLDIMSDAVAHTAITLAQDPGIVR
ncbi:MAG TPA: M28 family peptidase [Nocardioides sp.]|uniref:M28 family peptidase n=1 Tax=Nocardioides sp. TaxID=35761 RepID=UPI002D80244F|nr:M28 family peptidase [Nocardioides sp.]HET6652896.1 M28 family peptidase [Nocardioides sp.]